MFLLSSAKVAFTNMGPRAKPRLFSVSLTQNFQRGRQVWKTRTWLSVGSAPFLPAPLIWGLVLPGWGGGGVGGCLCFLPELQRDTFSDPVGATLGTEPRRHRTCRWSSRPACTGL